MSHLAHNEKLRTEPVGRLLLHFSIPAIIGMMVSALYNVVDRIYIGRIGALAMTGIGLNQPFMLLLMGFGMLIGIGAASRISIRLGEGRPKDAELILGNAISLLTGGMLVITMLGLLFKRPLLYLFGASGDTFDYANDYITIILFGAVFQGLGFGLNHSIRAEGSPRIAMYSMLLGAIINIALDPLFIFGFGMGIRGAALATVISQFVTMLWVLYHFMSGKSKIRFHPANLRLQFPVILSIVSIGVSPFMMQVAASIVGIISNNALKTTGGDMAIGAMTVIHSIVIFSLMPIFGINQGSQPILGFNYGAKAYDRVRKTLWLAIMAASSITMTAFLLTQFFPGLLIRAFNDEAALLAVAIPGLRIYLSMLPFIGFQIVSANYFQAVGKAPKAIFLSMLRQVIVLIPMLLLLPRFFGLKGVWLSGPVADFSATLLTAIFLVWELRHLRNAHQQQQASPLQDAVEERIETVFVDHDPV